LELKAGNIADMWGYSAEKSLWQKVTALLFVESCIRQLISAWFLEFAKDQSW
jgi:hypothetical protein